MINAQVQIFPSDYTCEVQSASRGILHDSSWVCCLCVFGIPWRPNMLHSKCRSVPLSQGYSASCWEKSSDGNLWLLPPAVILSHAELPLDKQATSVLANQTAAELQHGHMVVWIGCCQHRASWGPHPAPAWQPFRAVTVLWTRVEFIV